MKDKRALQKIREEFQRFPIEALPRPSRRWNLLSHGKHDLLAHALLYLCDSMEMDRAAVFLLDESQQVLVARQLVDRKDVLPGEEEIALLPHSALARVLDGRREYLTIEDPHAIAYIPLRAFGHIFGILRVESVRRKIPFTEKDIPLLNDFAHELATAMRG